MYPLIAFTPEQEGQAEAAVLQGAVTLVACARRADCTALVDRLLLPASGGGEPAAEFQLARHRVRRLLPARRIGLVSRQPTVLSEASVLENLGLVQPPGMPARRFWHGVERLLDTTGLLRGVDVDASAGSLPWAARVEMNFAQALLREPECLLFDRVFETDGEGDIATGGEGQDGEAGAMARLPALFRQRFPLRAIVYLQHGPALPAALHATSVVRL